MNDKFQGDIKTNKSYSASPDDLVIDPEFRGRFFAPDRGAVERLALSMFREGQISPVECRKLHDGRLQVTAGYTRVEAARLLRAGFTHAGTHYHLPEFRLKLNVQTVNDDEAFKRAVQENNVRSDRSPVDDAFNQQKFRDRYSWTDAQIAEFWGQHPSHVSRLKKLLPLPESTLRKLHTGDISFQAAIELSEVDPKQHEAMIAETGGTATEIRESKRKSGKTGGQKRTLKQVQTLLKAYTIVGDDETHPVLATYSILILAYMNGEIDDKGFEKKVRHLEGKK